MKPEQITAWALDEASAEERQQLEATLHENPQQKQTAEETKAFCDFLLSELRDDSLALTDAQRERLVGQSSRVPSATEMPAPPPTPRPPQTKWNIGIIVRLAVAACVALGGFWTWQAYTLNQLNSHVVVAAEAPSMKVSLPQAGDAKKKMHEGAETRMLASAPVKAVIVEQKPTGKPLPQAPMPAPVAAPAALALSKQQRVMTPGDVEKLKRIQDQNAYALNFGDQMAAPAAPLPGLQAQKMELAAAAPAGSLTLPTTGGLVEVGTGGVALGGTVTPADASAVVPPRLGDPMQSVANTLSTAGTVVVNGAAAAPLGRNQTVDLMSAATVTTKSGTQATMTVTREFANPSELGIAPILPRNPMPTEAVGTVDLGKSPTYTGSTTITGGTLALTTVSPSPSAMAAAAGPLVLDSTSVVAGAKSATTLSNTTVISPPAAPAPSGQYAFAAAASKGAPIANEGNASTVLSLNQSGAGSTFYAGTTSLIGSNFRDQDNLSPSLGADFAGASEKTNSFSRLTLGDATSHDFGPATVSFGYSFIHNMGSLANGAGLNQHSRSLSGYGMNDIQQLTLGAQTNLGPIDLASSANYDSKYGLTSLDLNEVARVATAAMSNPATVPQNSGVIGGWAVVDGSKSAASTNGGTSAQQKPQPAATFTLSGGTLAVATPAAAPKPTSNSAANGPAVQGNSTVRMFMRANAAIPTDAPPAQAPGAQISNPQPDTRYFASVGDVAGYATKDMAQRQESPTLRRDNVSRESYTHIIENELKDVAREPLSTLSIDVDTASYANVRRFLNQGMIPPPDAVRIEELVNYFPTTEEGPVHEAKEPFGVRIELAPCPWQPVHRLARIAIKGRERDKDRKPSNLVFLVDVSGSMNQPAKLPLVQQSLRMLTEQLGEGDSVTMVVYAGSSGVVLPPTNGEKKGEILAAIDRISAGGSTHGSAGIKLAYEQAVAGFIKGGVNRVILCTDGDFNVGVSSPEELEKLIKHKAKTGVFLSVLGFGSGNLQDRTMETLADKGNGNYAYIDSLSEARKVLVEQMGGTLDTIAKDVKIQVEFNPAAVRSYRLIGYENRLLAKEDFNDDTKDAGEIGAGHSVVALYEIVPANLPPGTEPRPAVDSLKYQAPAISPAQLVEAAKSGEMMTVKLRYKEPDSDLSKLIEVPTKDAGKTLTASSDEFKFSAAVASFGLLLRDSSYKGTLSWETVRRLALDGKGADTLGYRGEFLQLIDKARGLKETK
jgi:autotransporter-associated beta strand protein